MPYSAEHKARTRARIVESARLLFNRHGFERVSIDDIMKRAGLTRGGFYNHFASKEELYAEAVQSVMTSHLLVRRTLASAGTAALPPRRLARALIERYLSDEVLGDVDQHCPLMALPSDVARAGLKVRGAYTSVVEYLARIFRAAFPADDVEAERKALLIVSLCVGGMVIARTTDDVRLQGELRAVARAEALAVLERSTAARPPGGRRRAASRRLLAERDTRSA
ncbi:TetR/AcrR family transcriptional regulator [Sorangium sp. So ce131]|uniref:TetR/AcrR family transcriptional regulator n=1 Tax=Sorangium sp. So ce131 TaxID=3133282 RepID=UPI003F6348C3